MKIYVNNSRSATLCALEVESNTTVECVQNKIQEKLEIPAEQQRLFFTDKVLDVEKRLGGYEICNESSIKLVQNSHRLVQMKQQHMGKD
jgi:hypothetical protein